MIGHGPERVCVLTGLPSCAFKVTGTGTRNVVPLCDDDTLISPAARASHFPSCCGLLFAMFSSWCILFSWAMMTAQYGDFASKTDKYSLGNVSKLLSEDQSVDACP